jgi:peptide-methionine (S)-S-oxide reductase
MMRLLSLSLLAFLSLGCQAQKKKQKMTDQQTSNKPSAAGQLQTATFGNGCFWCTEAIFQQVEGVVSVQSGYSGGANPNPTYKEVCEGNTGHAECLNITYDPAKVSFDDLLEIFWQTHDPTTLNRQGNDVGTQYRSVIFYHNDQQKQVAEKYKAALDKSGAFKNPIVTTLEPFTEFYVAENYHQNYYNENGTAPYCQFVIRPKIEKFQKVFKHKLRKT